MFNIFIHLHHIAIKLYQQNDSPPYWESSKLMTRGKKENETQKKDKKRKEIKF